MSFFGNEASNADIRRQYWSHGLFWGGVTTLASIGAHFALRRVNKSYASWTTPRYVYILGSIFIGSTAYFAESEEIRLAKLANEARLIEEKTRREIELLKSFEQRSKSPLLNNTNIPKINELPK